MRGRIRKLYKTSWTIILSLDRDYKTGKRKQKWINVKGPRRNAEKRLDEIMHQYHITGTVDTTNIKFGELLEKWLAVRKPNLSPNTYERYDNIIQKYLVPELGKTQLTKLRTDQLESYYSKMLSLGLASATVHKHHTIIHAALSTAVHPWGYVGRNVADNAGSPPNSKIEMDFWNIDEMNQFIESIRDNPHYALFYLALFTGMGRSEILGLSWPDVDLLGAQLSVRQSLHQLKDKSFIFKDVKTKYRRRTIALTPSTVSVLRNLKQTNDLVFCKPDGNPLRPMSMSKAWTQACIKSGVKVIRLHDARHTHATILLKQGVHPKIVQERLGHSSIQMTLDTYSHIIPGLQEAAAKAFDASFIKSFVVVV
jgi:integrase